LIPFTIHWYTGVDPPFITVDEKLTVVPEQTLFASGVIVMLTGNCELTVIEPVEVNVTHPPVSVTV
jgi:hypothetical protein